MLYEIKKGKKTAALSNNVKTLFTMPGMYRKKNKKQMPPSFQGPCYKVSLLQAIKATGSSWMNKEVTNILL